MAKLILQRANLQAIRQKYKIYLNRTVAGEIGFAKQIELELKPGRYQLAVGSFFAKEAEAWFDISDHDRAFEIHSESIAIIENLPKYHHLKLVAKGPIQLKKQDELIRLKRAVKKFIWKFWIFNFLYASFLIFLINEAVARENGTVLYVMSALLLLNLVATNINLRKYFLRKIKNQEKT